MSGDRAEIGYTGAAQPELFERDGRRCTICGEPSEVLHQDPRSRSSIERTICGGCQGKLNAAKPAPKRPPPGAR